MQTIIANLIKNFSTENRNKKDQGLYLRGVFDGMQLLCEQLQGNLIEIEPEETDPIFVHNWNYIINTLTDKVTETIDEAYEGMPSSLKEENEIRSRD